jgi:hypothetical protein
LCFPPLGAAKGIEYRVDPKSGVRFWGPML